MKTRELLFILFIITGLLLVAGCSQPAQQSENNGQTTRATATTPAPAAPSGMVTPLDLTVRVKEAVAFASENGRDKAVAAFNDPTTGLRRTVSTSLLKTTTGRHLLNLSNTDLSGRMSET